MVWMRMGARRTKKARGATNEEGARRLAGVKEENRASLGNDEERGARRRTGSLVRRASPLILAFLWALGCSKGSGEPEAAGASTTEPPSSDHKDADHKDEEAHAELPRRVRISEEVIAAAKIQSAPVKREVLSPAIVLPGEVSADPDKIARVASPASGRIESIAFKEGASVKRGDVLAVIRVPELGKVRGAMTAALARAKAARANADRLKRLVDQGLATSQEHENAIAEAAAYEAEARALSAELSAMGTGGGGGASLSLRAPISGVVVTRDAVVGQPVTAETVLATIADLSSVWFLARVFEKDLARLHAGSPAEVALNAYPGERFEGTLDYLGKQVDPIARTLTARVLLTNRDEKLRLGLFGTARISIQETATRPAAVVVARDALAEVGGKQVVFVRQADGDYELHEVVIGESAAGKVEVLSGLREGEDVVIEGVFTLKSMVLKSAFAEEE
jgi:cobalt-zinc-cadmium efflux system membrane fusion protein